MTDPKFDSGTGETNDELPEGRADETEMKDWKDMTEFYPGETCESESAAGDCENLKLRLFSAFQFFDHSGAETEIELAVPDVGNKDRRRNSRFKLFRRDGLS